MHGIDTTVPAGPVVGSVMALVVAAGAVLLWRGRVLSAARMGTVVAAAVYVGAVLSLTLFPLQVRTGDYANRVSWIQKINLAPVVTIDSQTFLLNVLMLVPVGVLIPLLRRRVTWGGAFGIGLSVSLFIEGAQWVTDIVLSSGRTADVNDVIANSLGALVGYAAVRATARTRSGAELLARFAVHAGGREPAREDVGV